MRFNSLAVRVGATVVLWLMLISALHYWFNVHEAKRKVVRMGYMPVLTNLGAPLLDYASRDGDGIRFKALKFASFAEMAEALRNDKIEAAFIIAPLAIVLRRQGVDVKVVCIGNRHESTLVTRKDLQVSSLRDLVGRTLAVPMRYSGHNISILRLLEQEGLTGKVKVVELNPPDMAAAMTTGALDAYFVGEPFASQALKNGVATTLYRVEEVWPGFICNLVITKEAFIKRDPDTVDALVHGVARAGIWARDHAEQAAEIASQYWNQPVELIVYAMNTPKGRIVYDRFLPIKNELQGLANLMGRYDLLDEVDVSGLVEDNFARDVAVDPVNDISDILVR